MKNLLIAVCMTFSAGLALANTNVGDAAKNLCSQYQTFLRLDCSKLEQLPQPSCASALAVADQYDEVATDFNFSIINPNLAPSTRAELISVQNKLRQISASMRIPLVYGNEELCKKMQ